MRRRLRGGDEHADVANARNNLGLCLQTMARLAEALPHYEAALATWRRLHGDVHPSVVTGANRVGSCLRELGRYDESVAHYELSLEVCQRLHGASDHPATATTLHGLALALEAVGRGEQAVQRAEQALAMWHRLFPRIDHPDKASTMRQYARLLLFERGDAAAALPHFEQALAMLTRTFRGQDNAAIALARHDLAYCLQRSGRDGEALRQFESALAMLRRLGAEHTEARLNCQDNIAHCLRRLGRVADSLASYEANMAERVRLEDVDPWTLAIGYSHLAYGLTGVGRHDEAWQQFELGWAIVQRIHASRDHADVVRWLCHAVHHLYRAGKIDEAEARATAGLAMARRLYGERDHPLVALALDRTAVCLLERLQLDAALAATEAAVAMVERLRGSAKATAEMRQSLFDELKESGTFERLQLIQTLRGDGAGAFSAAERSRGRGLLDLVEEQRFDVMAEAERRAALRGDAAAAARLAELRREVQAARLEGDRLLHQLTQIDDGGDGDAMAARRRDLRAASDENAALQRRLAGERARLLADVQPLGGVRSPAEVQAALQTGELLLHYTVSPQFSQVRVLARDGDIEVVPLIGAHGVVQRTLPAVLPRMSSDRPLPSRGRDPDGVGESHAAVTASRELFAALVPPALWERVRGCKRVFVAAHGELHRLPFELLVTAGSDGAPVHWLDAGPPTAYVPSGSVLHWLRQRTAEVRDDATSLDLLAVGDPGAVGLAPTPADGALVIAVSADGPGARAGLHVGDVVLDYDGQAITDDRTLRDARVRTEAAIEDGTRAADSIPLEVWRRGERVTLRVRPGLLGVEVARGKAGSAVATADGVVRSGEIERLRQLPPLHGARAETEAIGAVFAKHGRASEQLLGGEATEPAVFDLAAKAKYLHFACHGVAEEYAEQSLSMLVLSPPSLVLPGDDGLLQLTDLLQSWRGRLASCRLVVLSACRSNVGPTFRDDAPQALPVGFLFAGAPAVISSLWAVDDASTRELMVDFYSRLLGGEIDQLAAFTAAKRTLRAKFPDPFHWAPFLYLGSPE